MSAVALSAVSSSRKAPRHPEETAGPLTAVTATLLSRIRAFRKASSASAAAQTEMYRSAVLDRRPTNSKLRWLPFWPRSAVCASLVRWRKSRSRWPIRWRMKRRAWEP